MSVETILVAFSPLLTDSLIYMLILPLMVSILSKSLSTINEDSLVLN